MIAEKPVLVGYATRYGSTKQVAEAMATTLRNCRLAAECQPVTAVQSLNGYGAVLLGAPLYVGAWHKDALAFVARQQGELAARPVALFALGPISHDKKELADARNQLDNALCRFSWLKPIAIEVFPGKYDPARLRFPDNLLKVLPASPLRNLAAADQRNWDAMRNWVAGLAGQLAQARDARPQFAGCACL